MTYYRAFKTRFWITASVLIHLLFFPFTSSAIAHERDWNFNLFKREESAQSLLSLSPDSFFFCPIQQKDVRWEGSHIFNPGAIVRKGKVYLFYRAEDDYGEGIGYHTSRIGIATSKDGLHFKKMGFPILYPAKDSQEEYEFPGGCEDPRIVEAPDGRYIMTYTQWNRSIALLAVATSFDLIHWEKQGYAFKNHLEPIWSKSGSIVTKEVKGRLIAAKIQDKYWMYWGEGTIHAAVSSDLVSWQPLTSPDGTLLVVAGPREGRFDSALAECGPPAVLTKNGIALIYNGKNAKEGGATDIFPEAYSVGQLLFDKTDPVKILQRSEEPFLKPERSYETQGQYGGGTVFSEGLIRFRNRWFLYYGAADSAIGVATL